MTSSEINSNNLPQVLQQAYELRESKDLVKSQAIGNECFKLFPDDSRVNCFMGILSLDKKNYAEAEKFFNSAIAIAPQRPEAYFFLGQLFTLQGKFTEAENAYLQCIKIDPNHLQALFHLSKLYERKGNFQNAINTFQKIIKQNPRFAPAYYNLGIIHHRLNNLNEAIENYRKTIELEPRNVYAISNLGAALTKDRRYEKAIPYYQKALEINPSYLPAITNLGGTYIEMGDLKQGEYYIRQSLSINPTLAANWRNLTLCVHYTSLDNPDLKAIEKLLNSEIPAPDKVHCYFALGKIYDDCGQYEKAFSYYEQGNTLQQPNSIFNENAFAKHVNKIIRVYDEYSLPPFEFDDVNAPIPIFIVGTARSGKSLLESILIQNKIIKPAGEVGIYDLIERMPIKYRPKGTYPYWFKNFNHAQAKALRNAYYHKLSQTTDIKTEQYVIDTIPGNILYIGLLKAIFPKARFIHSYRNPMDAGLLIYFKYFIDGHGYSYDLTKLGSYYKNFTRLIDYWKSKYPGMIIDCVYENLVTYPEKTIKQIYQALKIPEAKDIKTDWITNNEIGHSHFYKSYLKPFEEALQSPETVDDVDSDDPQKEILDNAFFHYQQGDLEGAKMLCETLIEKDTSQYNAYHLLGVIHFQLGDNAIAVQYFEQALALAPHIAQLHMDISRAYRLMGKHMQEEKHLKLAQSMQNAHANEQPMVHFTDAERAILFDVFTQPHEIIDEYEKKILVQGKITENETTQAYMTKSWDQYFEDLSYGRFRMVHEEGKFAWRPRTWHFLFKNIALVDHIIKDNSPQIKILDIGSSSGYFRRFLEGNLDIQDKKEIFYWGLDIRTDMLLKAIKQVDDLESGAKGNKIPSLYVVQDTEFGLPFKDQSFDYVVNFEMIKYLPIEHGKALLKEIKRVLKPDGELWLSSSYHSQQPGFMQSVPFEQLETLLRSAGFEITLRKGSQSNIHVLAKFLKENHKPLVNDLLAVHPAEMVGAMLTPLYPQLSDQVTFCCKIRS